MEVQTKAQSERYHVLFFTHKHHHNRENTKNGPWNKNEEIPIYTHINTYIRIKSNNNFKIQKQIEIT